ALAEICEAYGVPCISGKDSMKNDSMMGGVKISIPPTLLFSVIAKIDDVTRAVTVDVKSPGAIVYLLGTTADELGASELYRHIGKAIANNVPQVHPDRNLALYRTVQQAIERELLQSCHCPARGGLAIALARTALGGRLGLDLDLDQVSDLAALRSAAALFSESCGRLLVTVDPEHGAALEDLLPPGVCARLGTVTDRPELLVRHHDRTVIRAGLDDLERRYKETFDAL
ncbi:MAG: phosphoribosylformylglycinamidine synthase, partial [Deltaproteobacteria bacterium]